MAGVTLVRGVSGLPRCLFDRGYLDAQQGDLNCNGALDDDEVDAIPGTMYGSVAILAQTILAQAWTCPFPGVSHF